MQHHIQTIKSPLGISATYELFVHTFNFLQIDEWTQTHETKQHMFMIQGNRLMKK
jgi:hypothetical protein